MHRALELPFGLVMLCSTALCYAVLWCAVNRTACALPALKKGWPLARALAYYALTTARRRRRHRGTRSAQLDSTLQNETRYGDSPARQGTTGGPSALVGRAARLSPRDLRFPDASRPSDGRAQREHSFFHRKNKRNPLLSSGPNVTVLHNELVEKKSLRKANASERPNPNPSQS